MLRTRNSHRPLAALLLAVAVANCCYGDEQDESIEWHRVTPSDVSGKGWTDTAQPFDRLPGRAETIVRREVWELARHSSGLYVDFVTDAKAISARWTVTSDRLAMSHMPAAGVSGIDMYVRHQGKWSFLGAGQAREFPANTVQLVGGLKAAEAEYRLYFPLYNGVSSVEIGVPWGASFRIAHHENDSIAPVVFYGTSITQGGCASRPGMSYTSILGRRMNVPVINLGFSGNGKAEPEVARFLAELKTSAFVLDPIANLFPEDVRERIPTFIAIIRQRQSTTPIILVESLLCPDIHFSAPRSDRITASNAQLRKVFAARRAAGDNRIWLIPACDLTTDGGEGTVDGLHPTDVGFLKLSECVEPTLRAVLNQ